jgi:hypothetical protein
MSPAGRPTLLLLATTLAAPLGCGLFGPEWAADAQRSRVAVLLTNTSDVLAHVLIGGTSQSGAPQQWLVPVAPHGWNSLVLDCSMEQIVPLGTLLTAPADPNTVSLPFSGDAAESGNDFRCGSVLVVQVEPGGATPGAVRTTLRVARRMVEATAQVDQTDGFVVVEVHGLPGVSAELRLSWEDKQARVFASTITLSGREASIGFLLPCPLARFGLGHLDDPGVPAGAVRGTPPAAAAPLADIACGSTVIVRLQGNADAGYELALAAEPDSAAALQNTFEDARAVLDAQPVATQPTNALQLLPLPPPPVPAAPV